MTIEEIRARVHAVIMARLDSDPARRGEALHDFLALSLPNVSEMAAKNLAGLVPELSKTLYAKWIDIFADRLLATVPADQLEDLCDGTEENGAALCLTYMMFMESARMEKQVAEDLAALGALGSPGSAGSAGAAGAAGEQADALGAYLRHRLGQKKAVNNAG